MQSTFLWMASRSLKRATSRSMPALAALCLVSSASSTAADCMQQSNAERDGHTKVSKGA